MSTTGEPLKPEADRADIAAGHPPRHTGKLFVAGRADRHRRRQRRSPGEDASRLEVRADQQRYGGFPLHVCDRPVSLPDRPAGHAVQSAEGSFAGQLADLGIIVQEGRP